MTNGGLYRYLSTFHWYLILFSLATKLNSTHEGTPLYAKGIDVCNQMCIYQEYSQYQMPGAQSFKKFVVRVTLLLWANCNFEKSSLVELQEPIVPVFFVKFYILVLTIIRTVIAF